MKITARLADASDAPQFTEWVTSTSLNLFDPDIATYPNLRTLAIDKNGSPVLYIPFQPTFTVESLAHKPDITPRENAVALRAFQDAIEKLAAAYGIREIYFMCKDESLIDFVEGHGYERVKCAVLRKKIGKAEEAVQ
jgi:hypothetical protein